MPQSSATGLWSGAVPRRALKTLSLGAAVASFALVAVFAIVPTAALTSSAVDEAQRHKEVQTLVAVGHVATPEVTRDSFQITPGRTTFINGGTNYDWAKLVLLNGGWPVTDNNVTVITRWMRQENYIDTWWNRNNPLNNGWGSGGGGGLGSYPSLVVAAENAAEALNTHPGYSAIIEGFATSAPTEVTESAIWASPWASGHYANGAHWHYTPVPVVKAPAEAW
ncbi:MAG TPA: hypothetical protein VFT01_01840 [Homoserinimonas sp.]|nr:hypothetical protein [Homoserinimonas sp.]